MELLVSGMVVLGMPLLFAALGGLIAERGGVLNLGLEGLLLATAFTSALVAGQGRSVWAGLVVAIAVGGALGLLLGWLTVVVRADQVVTGIAFSLAALGLTGFAYGIRGSEAFQVAATGDVRVPVLADIPWLGPLFDQHWLAYVGYALVPVIWYLLMRTGVGLRLRAAGEYAEGARASGVHVVRVRLMALAASGAVCALGGAFMVLADSHEFVIDMSNGRGYIAFAIIILGRWTPLGVLLGAAAFAFAQGLDLYAQARSLSFPLELIQALPYVVALVAAALLGRRVRPPAEEGKPLLLSE